MSLSPEAAAGPVAGVCPLCGTDIAASASRCPACGYHLAGVEGRPGPWTHAALWWTAGGLLIVYAITVLIVAIAR